MRDRGTAWATATGDGDSYEVVLYLTLHDAVRRAHETATTLAGVIGELAGSVLAVGATHEELLVSGAYPQLAFAGEAPGLLSELGSAHRLPAPEIALAASGWEPIGLGAIQDLAQERYGPVDLDRSQVRLDPATESTPGCPACAGGRLSFPAELDERRAAMCAQHAEQAHRIITERLERAPASNRDGWDAIVGGSSMRSEQTFGLPLWLQHAADRDRQTPASESELREDAELALELATRLAGQSLGVGLPRVRSAARRAGDHVRDHTKCHPGCPTESASSRAQRGSVLAACGRARGASAVLVLRGEAGVGKTSLLRYATQQASSFRIVARSRGSSRRWSWRTRDFISCAHRCASSTICSGSTMRLRGCSDWSAPPAGGAGGARVRRAGAEW
jgi:hypothetical protein